MSCWRLSRLVSRAKRESLLDLLIIASLFALAVAGAAYALTLVQSPPDSPRLTARGDARLVGVAARDVVREHDLSNKGAAPPRSWQRMAPRSAAPAGPGTIAGHRTPVNGRVAVMVFLALTFAGMCVLTVGMWRHLRRELAAPRRVGWRL